MAKLAWVRTKWLNKPQPQIIVLVLHPKDEFERRNWPILQWFDITDEEATQSVDELAKKYPFTGATPPPKVEKIAAPPGPAVGE